MIHATKIQRCFEYAKLLGKKRGATPAVDAALCCFIQDSPTLRDLDGFGDLLLRLGLRHGDVQDAFKQWMSAKSTNSCQRIWAAWFIRVLYRRVTGPALPDLVTTRPIMQACWFSLLRDLRNIRIYGYFSLSFMIFAEASIICITLLFYWTPVIVQVILMWGMPSSMKVSDDCLKPTLS